jgi:hypothetical protein
MCCPHRQPAGDDGLIAADVGENEMISSFSEKLQSCY